MTYKLTLKQATPSTIFSGFYPGMMLDVYLSVTGTSARMWVDLPSRNGLTRCVGRVYK